ncbi:esterase [Hyphomicrobium nitrativorans NL23]|uniref:Esterase n=1 Tax=Hyphomicrobium nitrativorans NL23 TaxID=1029756 RepID=V5SB99_9HYPH|nr:polyhydroxyalkanoate depolymerase [Hyphomicrobium nitrativorans]AHB47249.1 esterase [Hyphomicrobium nitrativorans NL23]
MLYHWYEMSHVALKPARAVAESVRYLVESPLNPFAHTPVGRHASAACEVFERTTRRYDKPVFGISQTEVGRRSVAVTEQSVWERPFCRLVHFRRDIPVEEREGDPKVLLVAPMSGHFATLLRGTVEALLPSHEVYITDWQDARAVPLSAGTFGLDDYIDYVRDMLQGFRGDVHVFAVCQPAVPVLSAVSLMEEDDDPALPLSMILAGGPIDTRMSPTAVNRVAVERGTEWFRRNVITNVPWPNQGVGRQVYPGFLQLSGFMSMNLDRHANAHKELFMHLVHGDGDSAEKHRTFYDEYLAVMDLAAEFYLDTIERVFVQHALPHGSMTHRGRRVVPGAIRRTALMTIEGGKDDITGLGQCRAAHDLCTRLPAARRLHLECPEVGHYGIFNGSRFRAEIAPAVAQFIRSFDPRAEMIPTRPAASRVAAPSVAGNYDPASVAFTFAPANDVAPVDPDAAVVKPEKL